MHIGIYRTAPERVPTGGLSGVVVCERKAVDGVHPTFNRCRGFFLVRR